MAKVKTAKRTAPAADKRRPGGLRALAVPVGQITRATLGRRSLAEAELTAQWASVAGADLARLCVPRRILFSDRTRRRDGTLVLSCRPGENLRLQHMEPVIIGRTNAFFGYPVVARIRLEPARSDEARHPPPPAPRRDLSPEDRQALAETSEVAVEAVADEGLRAALRRLARTLSESR